MSGADPQIAAAAAASSTSAEGKLARRIGLFDATMVVMGGIVGAGIFINPYVVARQVRSPLAIVGAWVAGGVVAMMGAFVYAELAARMPRVGGQYAYLRAAYHPLLGFLYGWVLLPVIQTGGMAAVTVTFARYFLELTGWPVREWLIVVITLLALTIINCLGVSLGSRVQSALMVLKIAAIAGLIVAGGFWVRAPHAILQASAAGGAPDSLSSFGAALIPVLFAYGGWQTANFIAAEIKHPRRNLARALVLGVAGVVALYVGVNVVYVRALGPQALAATTVPASAVMRLALGERGATWIALGIAISALGFLSQSILTAPRVYFAMAEDGVFFSSVAQVSRSTRVPVIAILLQSAWTAVIALAGRYEQILNYVVSMDFLFFGLTATCLFRFRRRGVGEVEDAKNFRDEPQAAGPGTMRASGARVPGHPWTTAAFVASCWLVVANTIYKYPGNSLLGIGILLLGIPVYFLWRRARLINGG